MLDENKNRLSERIREGVSSFDAQERYQLMQGADGAGDDEYVCDAEKY